MKAATTAAKNLVKNNHSVKALPKVRAEWEHNRFSPIEKIEVTPVQTPDEEWKAIYDLDSIGMPNRPRNGVAKLRFDANGRAKARIGFGDLPAISRFYLPTEVDPYRYFSSTQKTKTVKGLDDGYAFDQPIQIDLVYEDSVIVNKIVIGFETAYGKPKSFSIQTTSNGTTWSTIASTASIDVRGQVVLWRGDSGEWTTTPDYDSPTTIRGIRVSVASMDLAATHLDVIQIGARLENDISDFVESYSRGFELSDRSLIAPLGRASSNEGSLSLSNIDRRFNNENESSLYFGLIGKKVKFTCDISLDASPTGSSDERIREFVMYSDSWGGQDEASVSVSLKDSTIFLQEVMVPKVFWEGLTVGAVIWQLMDILGLTNYQYTKLVADTGQLVPYFWSDGETTAWETISSLAEGTQTAVYFDEYDTMQIITRRAMFGESKAVDWNFDAITNGQKLADIVSMSTEDELVVNKVDVKYKPATYSDFNNGLPKMETVWEPDQDDVVLRSSPLVKDLLASNNTDMWISQSHSIVWPYEATVNIRGELLSYRGKEYVWRKPTGGTQTEWIYSLEDKQRIDAASDPNLSWSNAFTGRLKIVQRGLNGTISADHQIRPSSYNGYSTNMDNNKFVSIGTTQGMNYFDGVNTLATPSFANSHDITMWKHQATVNSADTTYGIRFRFPDQQMRGNGGSSGGLWFAGDSSDNAGYFLEISLTTLVELEQRQFRNEINLVRMPASGPARTHPAAMDVEGAYKGIKSEIVTNVWYDLDVRHKSQPDGSALITAFLNGVFVATWSVSSGLRPPSAGRFGMFVRDISRLDIEYLYAVYEEDAPEPDHSTFLDLRNGGYSSGYIDREWRYSGQYWTKNEGPTTEGSQWFAATNNRISYILDEFGPVVHEVREFEVSFDEEKVPVSHSYLYLSNESQVFCTNYWADAFGAKFTLANAARQHATVRGEDKLTLGEDNAIQHQFFIFGRALYQEDELTHTEEDKASIRRNGPADLTFDNDYIQTKEAAKDLGAWVVEQWAAGSDEIRLSVFGNPFIQIGDLVTINFPVKDMYPDTHMYYIVGLSNTFSQGLETEVTLRRARI